MVDGGFHAVSFTYGNPDEVTALKNNDAESVFRPPFPVPESLIQNLVSDFPRILTPAINDANIAERLILNQCGLAR